MNDITRFNKYFVKTPTCWLWTGGIASGYGAFWQNKKSKRAHRVSYELFIGDIPQSYVIDHLCKNTLCVNPEHLEPVTIRTNTLRGSNFIAKNFDKTQCIRGHVFDSVNTAIVKSTGERRCRACTNLRKKSYRMAVA